MRSGERRSKWQESLERSRARREGARRARRRRFRQRGASLSLIVAVLVGTSAGAAMSLADGPAVEAGAAKAEVILRKGDRGPAVATVQRRLRIAADGVFGKQTHRSVKGFQRRKRLDADGIVGPVTRRALKLKPFAHTAVIRPRRNNRRGGRSGEGLRNLPAVLVRIAECESGGDPEAISPSGRYRGKYQFSRGTWKDWGGRGDDPAEASEAHQDHVALRLYRARGTAPWPTCGR